MPPAVIPDAVVGVTPFIVTALSGWIGQAHWPDWANACVAGGVILAVSLICVFVAGASFTSNLVEDFLIVAGYMTAVMYGPLRPLHKYLIVGPQPAPTPVVAPVPPVAK
jgi:hypothetical protein